MALASGSRIGSYEIVSPLGAGGMGEVYRAQDLKLKRQVAIKILAPSLAGDPDRLARFQREAEVLASLNHPHIAAIYGVEDADGITALVMELVEGEDLSQRIARGATPLDEAVPIARQIAQALEAAHAQGIIHRDLKPANIKVRPDGTVKVLDFGLAKALEQAAGFRPAVDVTQSPTITSPAMTQAGIILGTAAYMAPEQAKGRPADKRADIWAFGCVLFEILTARRAFGGDDISDTLANVLKIEPDWSALPAETAPPIRTLLRSCLTKDARRRMADISTALFVLDHDSDLAPPHDASPAPRSSRPSPRRLVTAAGALTFALIGGLATWLVLARTPPTAPRISRLQLPSVGASALTVNGNDRDVTITPDGSRVVYVGNNGTQLFVRALDALSATPLFTGAPRGPFVSPDSEWVGFVDTGNLLKKVAISGGPAITLGTLDGLPRGATWGPDDTIIVATDARPSGLQRLPGVGGPFTAVTTPDRAQGEGDHFWPEFLPGGHAVLFTITAPGGADAAARQVAVHDLQTGRSRILIRGGSDARYVTSRSRSRLGAARGFGHLVYATGDTLRAVPFDPMKLELHGTPVPVASAVIMNQFGGTDAAIAGDGTLVYASGVARLATEPRTLVWVDRHGTETPIPAPPRPYATPRISPDGRRVALSVNEQGLSDLWVWDLVRSTLTRLTFEPAADVSPIWTPDSQRLIFASGRDRQTAIWVQAADGTGEATRLGEGGQRPRNPTAITADGRRVVFFELTPTNGRDVRLLSLLTPPKSEPLVETRFEERNGALSPDDRWLVYESNSTGQFELYARPFPDVSAGQWSVSSGGGAEPVFARNGQELFYVAPDGALMVVPVDARGRTFSAGNATRLLAPGYATGGITRQYDVAADGQRFLMLKDERSADRNAATPALIVVQNWDEELKRLAPEK